MSVLDSRAKLDARNSFARGSLGVSNGRPLASMRLLCAATIFLSSTLLFLVQPMMGKELLPLFGGAAAVWATCVVFFQCLLLLGYLYAHAFTPIVSGRLQMQVHIVLLLSSLFVTMTSAADLYSSHCFESRLSLLFVACAPHWPAVLCLSSTGRSFKPGIPGPREPGFRTGFSRSLTSVPC